MCFDPISLGAIGSAISGAVGSVTSVLGGIAPALSVASGLVGAYATYANGKAQSQALEMQAEQEAEAARQRIEQGDEESDRMRRAGAIQMGEQRAAFAANGIDVEGDLALDMLDDTQTLISDDAFSIRESARRDGNSLLQQSANSRTGAANARSQGTFGAVSTLLTTGAKVGSKFKNWSTPKANSDPWANLRGAY